MKGIFSVVCAALLLSACGGGSGGANDDDDDAILVGPSLNDQPVNSANMLEDAEGVVTSLPDIPSEVYMDATLSLRYPASWLVNPNELILGIDAQFFAPEPNGLGGSDNCSFDYLIVPGSTFLEAADEVLELLDPIPTPMQEFIEVNGVPASRATGNLTLFGQTLPATMQVMEANGQFINASCLGSGISAEAIELMLGSIVIN